MDLSIETIVASAWVMQVIVISRLTCEWSSLKTTRPPLAITRTNNYQGDFRSLALGTLTNAHLVYRQKRVWDSRFSRKSSQWTGLHA